MKFDSDKLRGGIYFEDMFIRPHILVERICRTIRKDFPTCGGVVAASGISGAALVVPVAMELDIPFGFVRTKSSHTSIGTIQCHSELHNPVIIDDFICSGKTMKKTILAMMKYKEESLVPAGIICYDNGNKKYVEKINSTFTVKLGRKNKEFPYIYFKEITRPYVGFDEKEKRRKVDTKKLKDPKTLIIS